MRLIQVWFWCYYAGKILIDAVHFLISEIISAISRYFELVEIQRLYSQVQAEPAEVKRMI